MNARCAGASQQALQRIYSEFMEMPGLCLTSEQARRLWGLDDSVCRQLLQLLVDAKFLACGPKGMYSRRTEGPTTLPRVDLDMDVDVRRQTAHIPDSPACERREEPTMKREDIDVAAHGDVPVLIASDHASDRECCARAIHERSRRAGRPFIRFRGTRPDRRDSELGQLLQDRFQQARGGSLFIDDVAHLGPRGQQALLVLLERRIATSLNPDARILAGASRSLDGQRTAGTFSALLFYRLNEIRLDLPVRNQARRVSQRPPMGARFA